MSAERYVIGIDFGTLSGRALVVRASDGAELGSAEHVYANGVIETALPGGGAALPPNWALQDPADWLAVLGAAVPEAVRRAGVDPADVVGIGTDFTACTVLPTTLDGTPLCRVERFADRPHAWPKLWKHHAAQPQADRINALAGKTGASWLARYGGRISAEWQFAKALQVLEEDPEVYGASERWIEAADWIVWQLTGRESRNRCTAGYKGIYQDGHYPSAEFCGDLDPRFADFPATRLEHPQLPLGSRAGGLSAQAARLTGLPAGIAVSAGNVDAHVSAPAAGAVRPGSLLAVMGTSTCHVMVADRLVEVPGMCGVVEGGVVEGSFGYEAGQSGVGDIFAWWVDHFASPSYHERAAERGIGLHELLTELSMAEPVGAHGLLVLDWMNGNRSVLVDHELTGVVLGLSLATRPEQVYRALLESTAFGARRIVEAFTSAGLEVNELVVAGGLLKNAPLMQLYADVTGLEISVSRSAQAPALGSAMHAAVAAGLHPDVPAASEAMARVRRGAYRPDPERARAYDALYADYRVLHDHFGRGPGEGRDDVLHRLHARRSKALEGSAR